ncbi:NUDIX hydrolase, partial [Pseudomonas sp. FW305-BF6]|uniref:NUDIX domain-containing protein n=1 Tax=Pseudomonas sp. FW305-BF6 TaxID=2070673 RepID=UPI000CC8C4DE
ENELSFAVIMARYNEKWIFVKQKNRLTWEIPGGKREKHETIIEAARRELSEETGAIKFQIESLCIYSVSVHQTQTFGQLFFAEVDHIG